MLSADQPKLSLKCPSCNRILAVLASADGKVVACPCGQKLRVGSRVTPAAVGSLRETSPAAKRILDPIVENRQRVATKPNFKLTVATFVGCLAAIVALVCLIFGAYCIYLGADIRAPVVMVFSAGLFAVFSVACLNPAHRTPAIRILAGTFSAISFATFVFSVVAPPKDFDLRRRGVLLSFAVLMAGIAYKGKLPSDDDAPKNQGSTQ